MRAAAVACLGNEKENEKVDKKGFFAETCMFCRFKSSKMLSE
jgi:hypothetical protein